MQYTLILVAVLLTLLFDVTLGEHEEEQLMLETQGPGLTTETYTLTLAHPGDDPLNRVENQTEAITMRTVVNISLPIISTETSFTPVNFTTQVSKTTDIQTPKNKKKNSTKTNSIEEIKSRLKFGEKRIKTYISPDYWEDIQLKSVALKLKQNPNLYKKFLDWSSKQPKHANEGDFELNELNFLQPKKNFRPGKKKAFFSMKQKKGKEKEGGNRQTKRLDRLFTKKKGNQHWKDPSPYFTSIDYNDLLMLPSEEEPSAKENTYEDHEQIGETVVDEISDEEDVSSEDLTTIPTLFEENLDDNHHGSRPSIKSYRYIPLYCILKTNVYTKKSMLYCFARRKKLRSKDVKGTSTSLSGGEIACPCCNNLIDINICARGPDDISILSKGTMFNKFQYRQPLFRIDMPNNCIRATRLNEMKNSRNYQPDF